MPRISKPLVRPKMNKVRKELSIFERGEIVGAWKGKISEREIGEVLNRPKSTVHDVISAYKDFEYETLPFRSDRSQLMTERDQRHLLRIVKKNRRIHCALNLRKQHFCQFFILTKPKSAYCSSGNSFDIYKTKHFLNFKT